MRRADWNQSKIRSARNCYLCVRNELLAKRYSSSEEGAYDGWIYLTTPGAYVVQRNGQVIYAGSTGTTFEERICSHHVIARFGWRWSDLNRPSTLILADTDVVTFYECADKVTAEVFEDDLIEMFHPQFNRKRAISLNLFRWST